MRLARAIEERSATELRRWQPVARAYVMDILSFAHRFARVLDNRDLRKQVESNPGVASLRSSPVLLKLFEHRREWWTLPGEDSPMRREHALDRGEEAISWSTALAADRKALIKSRDDWRKRAGPSTDERANEIRGMRSIAQEASAYRWLAESRELERILKDSTTRIAAERATRAELTGGLTAEPAELLQWCASDLATRSLKAQPGRGSSP